MLLIRNSPAAPGVALVCCAAAGYVAVTRVFVRDSVVIAAMAVLVLLALVADLRAEKWQRSRLAGSLAVHAALFLVSVLPFLWWLFQWWAEYRTTIVTAGPLLPYSDAASYVTGATSLLTLGEMYEWPGRRPIGTSIVAAALAVARHDLQHTLILLALLAGIATFIAARETWRTGGLACAAVYVTLSYLLIRELVPTVMMEIPAYVFASLGYALLLAGIRLLSLPRAACGLALVTIAQSIRPGAVLVIPLLAIYTVFRLSSQRTSVVRNAAAVALAFIVALVTTPLLTRVVSSASGAGFIADNAFVLYGIAAGNKSTLQVLHDYPAINRMPSYSARTRVVDSLFRDRLAREPVRFVRSFFDNYSVAWHRVFYDRAAPLPSVIPALAALFTLVLLLRRPFRRNSCWDFLVPVAAGLILSLPFVVLDWRLGSEASLQRFLLRLTAATFPFQAALAAASVPLALTLLRRRRGAAADEQAAESGERDVRSNRTFDRAFAGVAAAFLVLLGVTGIGLPIVAAARPPAFTSVPDVRVLEGSPEGIEVVFRFEPGSGVWIGPARQAGSEVMTVPLRAITDSTLFSQSLGVADHVRPGMYLYFANLLMHPMVGGYVLFDGVPQVAPGYLRARLRLLAFSNFQFLFRAESYAR